MLYCPECNKPCKRLSGLGYHIIRSHGRKMTDEDRKACGCLTVQERRDKWKKDNPYKYNSENTSEYNKNRPYYWRAHSAVGKALKNGSLTRQPCEVCGKKKTEAHHWNYKKEYWLDVQWLCKECHEIWHSQNRAIYPTEKEIEEMKCHLFD